MLEQRPDILQQLKADREAAELHSFSADSGNFSGFHSSGVSFVLLQDFIGAENHYFCYNSLTGPILAFTFWFLNSTDIQI